MRRLYRSGTKSTLTRESARYKSDLVGAREVRWDKGGRVSAEDYIFFKVKKKNSSIIDSKVWRVLQRSVAALKREEFVSDWMSCIVLRGRWCNVIVFNVCTTSDEKSDD